MEKLGGIYVWQIAILKLIGKTKFRKWIDLAISLITLILSLTKLIMNDSSVMHMSFETYLLILWRLLPL